MYYLMNISFKVIVQLMSQGQIGNSVFVCTHTRMKGAQYFKAILQTGDGRPCPVLHHSTTEKDKHNGYFI